ncbi:hypothetical protein AD428_01275 [Achromobacter sp. DMS1]|uniref:FxLYD domain-containing protein n=1 Tax=Achromobacter sp. DMS1 TaxID=1688405 RepID=UPI00069D8A10|nr:FxLYD domain-containing protein [Achromobacter sp. DMS1]KOF55341.1 hypothetical protein AD428_01275 [Achromobacter sp. DMS1]
MRTAMAVLALLAALAGPLHAQSLAYGVTLGNLQAVRDASRNESVITAVLANQSGRDIRNVRVTLVLYDAAGREVGRVHEDRLGPMADGEIKQLKAVTPLEFSRVTALDVQAD